ncbi:MAG: citrate lyase [Subtercola sp.]|nr:citrate lyase [Subtercola sp.]
MTTAPDDGSPVGENVDTGHDAPNIRSLAAARTWLFVPGDRPDRFAKAVNSGADVVIADLEDAVAPLAKPAARRDVVAALNNGVGLAVRLNAPGTAAFEADLDALAAARRPPRAVIVSHSEDAASLGTVAERLGVPIVALIESARGLVACSELAAVPGVVRFAFGAVDYSLDIGARPDDDVLAYAQSRLVAVSRAAALAAPIDTPSLAIGDTEAVVVSARRARRFGMGGKLCIHPAQVNVVEQAFRPTGAEVARARSLLAAASDDGAAAFDGEMIDRPVLERARQIVAEGVNVS